MSRVGKQPIPLPEGVDVECGGRTVSVKGPKGEQHMNLHPLVAVEQLDQQLHLRADYQNNLRARAMMGTTRSVLANMVKGVSEGFTRRLKLIGVGYRAAASGNYLELSLGYSHPVKLELPQGVSAKTESNNTLITLSGDNLVSIGQFAAQIRAWRPPEPYLGKGVSYEGERILRKAGKSGKK